MASRDDDKFDEQVNVKLSARLLKDLHAIEKKCGLAPTVLLRSLGQEAAAFFRKNGYFRLPVVVQPAPATGEEPRIESDAFFKGLADAFSALRTDHGVRDLLRDKEEMERLGKILAQQVNPDKTKRTTA